MGSLRSTPHEPWGLVLMGGGARGLAHIGVLKALDAEGLVPGVITGTSMGAVVGGLYAAGVPVRDLEALTTEMGAARLIDRPKLARKPRTMDGVFQQLMRETTRVRLLRSLGVEREDCVEAVLRRAVGARRIEDLPIRFACNAVDILTGREIVFSRGPLRKALRASMAYPLVFEAVRWKRMLLVDGGVIDNVPIGAARALGARKVVVPDIHRRLGRFPATRVRNVFQFLMRMNQITRAGSTEVRLREADFVFRVTVNVETFDFSQSRLILARGYRAARANLADIREIAGSALTPPACQ